VYERWGILKRKYWRGRMICVSRFPVLLVRDLLWIIMLHFQDSILSCEKHSFNVYKLKKSATQNKLHLSSLSKLIHTFMLAFMCCFSRNPFLGNACWTLLTVNTPKATDPEICSSYSDSRWAYAGHRLLVPSCTHQNTWVDLGFLVT